MATVFYDFETEISPLGELYSRVHFQTLGKDTYPIDPEIIATKHHGLEIRPIKGIAQVGVFAGIDATQSVLFIDYDFYMDDRNEHLIRQVIAHELGHIIFDGSEIRRHVPSTAREAYTTHLALRSKSGVETRANMFAGAFLVPRADFIRQVASILLTNIEDLQTSFSHMTVDDVIRALAASKMASRYGVSDAVISWRLENEQVAQLIGGRATSVGQLDVENLRLLAQVEASKKPSSRVLQLLPPDFLANFGKLTN